MGEQVGDSFGMPAYLIIIVTALSAAFAVSQLKHMKLMEEPMLPPPIPKWKKFLIFPCWVIYRALFRFLPHEHPWKRWRYSLDEICAGAKPLFWQLGAMMWYSLAVSALCARLLTHHMRW
jgi:hypothetical protein